MKCSLAISNFLEEISSLPHSTVSPLFLFHWSLRKAFLSLLVILWNSAFKWEYLSFSPLPLAPLLFTAICFLRPPQTAILPFLHFFFLGMVLLTASCTMAWTSVQPLQALLSDLLPWIYLSLPLYNRKGFALGHTWMVYWFSLLSSIKAWIWQ